MVGSTGSGKSKLALDLASHFDGEIVNADSMQIYRGNGEGVMTAHPSPSDFASVAHHLYGIHEIDSASDFNVQKYLELATNTIEAIQARGKLPIVVGSTNYYIEALLFE